MTLIEKLGTINLPKVAPLAEGYASTIEELWNTVIVPKLPHCDVVLKWHRTLMDYVTSPNAMFAIRGCNTAPKESYDDLRRGFLSRTDAGYSFFYTDNFHAAYYFKMALDGYVPSATEMLDAYNSRRFPARFGRDTHNERLLMAMPRGKDPGIQTAGYKIAHIFNVGKDYFDGGEKHSLSKLITHYFNKGERSDWRKCEDAVGSYFVRDFPVHLEAKRFLIAEFLRFVHPFNYFLTPKASLTDTPVCKDIAEYSPLINYVQKKIAEMYGDAYKEYLSYVMPQTMDIPSVDGTVQIDLQYGASCKQADDDKRTEVGVKPQNVAEKCSPKTQTRKQATSGSMTTLTTDEGLQFEMIREYLMNVTTSFRKLEQDFLNLESPPRGGGFVAKGILNSRGVTATMKGILSTTPIEVLINDATGTLKETLLTLARLK